MQRYARRREPDFAGRHECRNGVAELREPAARVHPVFGPGPTAELLAVVHEHGERTARLPQDRKSTRLNSSHTVISYAVFCLKKKNKITTPSPAEWPAYRPTPKH